jgi:predicted AlkP superfamily phosphohydrolase/phosphomutase
MDKSKKLMKRQTLVIGLDGATFDIIDPLIEAGRLPNIARFKAEGAWGRLRSVMHPESPQAWSSFLTGTNPGKHGILDFTRRTMDSYDWRVNTANDRLGPDVSEILAQQGLRAGLFNVPLTYPPRPTDGFVVSGMGTPGFDSDFTHPLELKKELLEAFGQDVWIEEEIPGKTPLEYLDALHRSIERTLQLGEFLLRRFPNLDLYVLVFMASDRVQHFFWNYVDPHYPDYVADAPQELKNSINGIYEHLDQAVGQLVEGREDWNIIVMSDHGGGPFYQMVDLNRWLEREGYLRFLDVESAAQGNRAGSGLRSAYRFFRRHVAPKLSRRQRQFLRKLMPQAAMNRLRGYRHNPTLNRVDWSRTRAYAQGAYGRIFLNMAGREPQGIVRPEEREQLLDEIRTKLLALKGPLTDKRVIHRIYGREELFQGPFLNQAPELLVEWHKWQYHTRDSFAAQDSVFSDPPYWQFSQLKHTGNHRLNGIFLMKGGVINSDCEIEGAQIVDLAPTLLYVLGASIPREMDGKILMQAFRPEIRERYPAIYAESSADSERPFETEIYTEQEEAAVRERLRQLGYVD